MKKCQVIADRVSLICLNGSIVNVDERQFEIAKRFLKILDEESKAKKSEETNEVVIEEPLKEEKPKKSKKK